MSLAATIRNLTVVLLLVIVGFGSYFFIYIQGRDHLLAQHHLRQLSNAATFASEALDGISTNVTNAFALGSADVPTVLPLADAIGRKRALIRLLGDYELSSFGSRSFNDFLKIAAPDTARAPGSAILPGSPVCPDRRNA